MPEQVQVKTYDCLEACRIADATLSDALEEYDPDADYADEHGVNEDDFIEMQACVRLHIAAMQEIVSGVFPSVRQSAFHAIREFVNLQEDSPHHTEGVLLAFRLAHASADEAVHLSTKLNPGEINEGYEIMAATRAMTGRAMDFIDSATWQAFSEESLALILKGKPVPTWKELRRAWIDAEHPDGRYTTGEPTWDHVNDEPLYMRWRNGLPSATARTDGKPIAETCQSVLLIVVGNRLAP
jgi:hypothetical protein